MGGIELLKQLPRLADDSAYAELQKGMDAVAPILGPWLEALNRRVVEAIGRDARNLQVGHAYLMEAGKPVTDFPRFARVLQEDIIPLLEEYCYDDYAALEKILGRGIVDATAQRIRHELFTTSRKGDLTSALLEPMPELTATAEAVSAPETLEDTDEDETNGQS